MDNFLFIYNFQDELLTEEIKDYLKSMYYPKLKVQILINDTEVEVSYRDLPTPNKRLIRLNANPKEANNV